LKIIFVSRSWPSDQNSGVSLISAEHVRALAMLGHDISIIGSNISVLNESLPVSSRFFVKASGTGALYSPQFVDNKALAKILVEAKPDLVIVEAWQTALTESAIDACYEIRIPVMMISHGISLHPYTNSFIDNLRSAAWFYYRKFIFPKRVNKLSVLTTLDMKSRSKRFYDRDIAKKMGIPVSLLVNYPVNSLDCEPKSFRSRKRQILVLGYFSRIKNQLLAIDILHGLPEDLTLRFIGQRSGSYYLQCSARVEELGLQNRVCFSQDDECDVADEIANSLIVLCTSITEALPISLIEAMVSGTPFVASHVGAISSMGGGVIVFDKNKYQLAIQSLASDSVYWAQISEKGRQAYLTRYTKNHVRQNLLDSISIAIKATCESFK
jgi:glycosyltransferase involved in cell wall biosynthesis